MMFKMQSWRSMFLLEIISTCLAISGCVTSGEKKTGEGVAVSSGVIRHSFVLPLGATAAVWNGNEGGTLPEVFSFLEKGDVEGADLTFDGEAELVPLVLHVFLAEMLHRIGAGREVAEVVAPGAAALLFLHLRRGREGPGVIQFDAQCGPAGALAVGDPETVAEKILAENTVLGGISRLTVLLDNRVLTHAQILRAIELLGTRVAPIVRKAVADPAAPNASA